MLSWLKRLFGKPSVTLEMATVEGVGLTKEKQGKIRLLGAQLPAAIPASAPFDKIRVGEKVYVLGQKGSVHYVWPELKGKPTPEIIEKIRKNEGLS